MKRSLEIEVAGERLEARGDRTLFWPAEESLFVADLHLGKGAAFRAGGMPVPSGSTALTLSLLERAVEETQARRLYVLGDLWHARAGRTETNRRALAEWMSARPDLHVRLIVGNHDLASGWELETLPAGERVGPFALRHHPQEEPEGYVLAGHLHPGIVLSGRGGEALRVPCFLLGPRMGILPAFGDLTGSASVAIGREDRVVVVADGLVGLLPQRDRFEQARR